MFFSLTYKGKSFNQRQSDNYVNLGQLCATHDKQLSDWTRTKQAQEYLKALAESLTTSHSAYSPCDLILTTVGGSEGSQSWGHPLVAIEVSRWIEPAFGVWCNIHIKQLIETGSTAIKEEPKTQLELVAMLAQEMVEKEKQLTLLASKVDTIEESQNAFQQKVDPYLPKEGYVTMEAYQKINKLKFQKGVGQLFYSVAKKIADKNASNSNIQLEYIEHPFKGTIISYPKSLLDFIYLNLKKDKKILEVKKRTLTWVEKI